MKKVVKIRRESFKTIRDFSGKGEYRKGMKDTKSGVYIWGFFLGEACKVHKNTDTFFPYYVGKDDDMYKRTAEHIASLCGGNMSVFNIENASKNRTPIGIVHDLYRKQSSLSKKSGKAGPPLPDPKKFPYLLHFPEGVHTLDNFFDDGDIQNQIKWMINHFCIMYLVTGDASKNIELEKFIGHLVSDRFGLPKSALRKGRLSYDRLVTKYYNKPSESSYEIENSGKGVDIKIKSYFDLFYDM